MDEWYADGREVPVTHPLSFERADRELCFNRIRRELAMPEANLHFPEGRRRGVPEKLGRRALRRDAGRPGRHQALGLQRPGAARRRRYRDQPPTPEEYRKLGTRVVDLHPITLAQNARTSGGGNITLVPTKALTVGPVETWKAEKVSIWQAARTTTRWASASPPHDRKGVRRQRRARCRCSPITPTCSSTSSAAASAPVRSRCTEPADHFFKPTL
jgi:glucosamine-6-phosphate deaminase